MADLIPLYFFLNDKLHKKIRVVKTADYVVAWSYEDERMMRYNYYSVRREASKAYTLTEVADLIEQKEEKLKDFMDRKILPLPSGRIYTMKNRRPGRRYWSEDDILYMRDRLFEVAPKNKRGEPYTNLKLISKSALLQKLHEGDTAYYVQDSEGNLTRVWKAVI